MNWSRGIALGCWLFLAAVNTVLLVQLDRGRQRLRQETSNLNQLADEVAQRADALNKQSAEMDKKAAELNALVAKVGKSRRCLQLFIPLPPLPLPAPEPARNEGPKT